MIERPDRIGLSLYGKSDWSGKTEPRLRVIKSIEITEECTFKRKSDKKNQVFVDYTPCEGKILVRIAFYLGGKKNHEFMALPGDLSFFDKNKPFESLDTGIQVAIQQIGYPWDKLCEVIEQQAPPLPPTHN